MMSTERLKTLHRQEQNQRKFVCVMNDVAKSKQDLYEGYIEKEKQEVVQKCNKSIVVTRRNIVRQRVLKQCMKHKREEVERENAKKLFGRYNGVSVEHIAEEVDPFIQRNHPQNRRKKKIDTLFREGISKGAILDTDTMHNKVLDYFDRPLVAVRAFEEQTNTATKDNSCLPAIQKSFYTGDVQTAGKHHMRELLNKQQQQHEDDFSDIEDDDNDDQEKVFVRRKVSKFLNDDVPDDMSMLSDAPPSDSFVKRSLRPVTLPPIKIGTDNETGAQYHKKPKEKKDCISDLVARMHEAKDNREREIKIKKERRAKRLQHERVFGIGSYSTSDNSRGDVYTSQTERQRPVSEYVTMTQLNTVPASEIQAGYQKSSNNGLRLPPIQR